MLFTQIYAQIKPALDEAGIEIPYPHRVINSKEFSVMPTSKKLNQGISKLTRKY